MTQILQGALDAGVAPARVLGCHPHDEAANLQDHAGASRSTLGVRPLPGDELAVPTENRVGRDNRRHLHEQATTEPRAQDSQAPPLVIGEAHALVAQLRFQDAVFFAQVLDDLVLLAFEPTDESRDEQMQRNHAPSLRQLPAMFSDTTRFDSYLAATSTC
jgi:hypothetical protein